MVQSGLANLKSKTCLTIYSITMELEMTRVSSKGQIVIPEPIRDRLNLKDGTRLLVFGENDTIILKKIGSETWDLKTALAKVRAKTRELKITRKDIASEVRIVRARRRLNKNA